jgi:hypothetical protein
MGLQTGSSGLEEKADVRNQIEGTLKMTERRANGRPCVCCRQSVEHTREFAVNATDDVGRIVSAVNSAPGALNEKSNDPRATGAAVRRATRGHRDQVGAADAGLNGKPNQAEASHRKATEA